MPEADPHRDSKVAFEHHFAWTEYYLKRIQEAARAKAAQILEECGHRIRDVIQQPDKRDSDATGKIYPASLRHQIRAIYAEVLEALIFEPHWDARLEALYGEAMVKRTFSAAKRATRRVLRKLLQDHA